MGTLIVLAGLYLIWFGLRVSVFNYLSQDEAISLGSKDIQIYFGALPIFVIGFALVGYGFTA